jgi:hypothetical protein
MDNYLIQMSKLLWSALKKFKFKKKVRKVVEPIKSSSNYLLDEYETKYSKRDPIYKYDRSDVTNYAIYSSGIEDFLEKEISRIGHIVFKKEGA